MSMAEAATTDFNLTFNFSFHMISSVPGRQSLRARDKKERERERVVSTRSLIDKIS